MNNDISESYVSFDCAKLLEKKGFDCICDKYYIAKYFDSNPYLSNDIPNDCFDYVSAPTHTLAIEWIRVNFGVWINIGFDSWGSEQFYWQINQKGNKDLHAENSLEYNTPQEATNTALVYALTKLI